MEHGALRWISRDDARAEVEGSHVNLPDHPETVEGSSWNPECELRRYHPRARTGGYFHDTVRCVDQLIRSMGVFRDGGSFGIFISESRDGDSTRRVVFRQNGCLSHIRYSMT